MKTAVVAIGGNAILRAGQKGTQDEQFANLTISCEHLVSMMEDGYDLVLTHGNGPQVGNIMLKNDIAKQKVAPMSLDVAVAESQGQIGYMFQQVLMNTLQSHGLGKCVVSVVTQVVVDEKDPAFNNPTKPIGKYYSKTEAAHLMKQKGWKMVDDKARGGWRRVVPSPMPIDIVEKDAIKRLIFTGEDSSIIVIAAGGGGIPVIKKNGKYIGVEAVIDKDLASSVLASSIGEELFVMLTDVNKVSLNFGKKNQTELDHITMDEAWRYYGEGQFPHGSMGPKIQAAIKFLQRNGKDVIITSPENIIDALAGKNGTHITK